MTEEVKEEKTNEKKEQDTATEEVTEETAVETTTDEEVRVEPEEEEVAVFSGDVDEEDKTYTYDQLQAQSEDYTDEEFNELAGMYEDTLNEIEEKEIVTGRVVSVDEDYVVVDIGFKSEGMVQTNEFPDEVVENLQPGDEVDVFLDKVEDQEGQLILSRRKADILHAWETIERAAETGEIVEGKIQRRIKGGMVADIMGIDAFLPGSQIDVRPVRDFDAYVGKTMEFQVVKLNMSAENVVVSHRALIESDLEEQREEILETIEEGQVLQGIVKNITDFGVFIDLGGVDGLLHITDLSWGRVDHPEEIVSLDQQLNVAVIDFDEETKRVSLGLKQLQPHPWEEIDLKYPENIQVQGRVVSIADYGAFIELEKGVEGLIHISEMSWTQHIKHPSQLVSKDDIIDCVVLNVNEPEKKISLGVKQLEKDPWEDIDERYPVGSKHKGTVRNLTNFGVFVELEPGIDGLIHISDLSWTEKINHPNEVIDKDEEIEVVILAIDFENRRITLGHKQIEENPWEKFAEEYSGTNQVEGEVFKITDKGVFVKLPHDLEGFIPASKTEAEEEPEENFEEGDTVEAYVIELDETNKNITLSQREKDVKESKSAKSKKSRGKKEQEGPAPQTGTPTLGEMSGLADLKKEMADKEKAARNLQNKAEEVEEEEDNADEEE
ncbi:30S ribosomal protein S1 [Aliifodinibius salipaludis]|uniref:Small ribosomal subunit protein bS1 n=1 Tax=Fodinibius salipaludis TaxID=2032627 RepID=A0A2A2G5U5_9BACT|nr:30S ribosomal protein S1 [Aliifodinibius salipaludis]PAU93136.1 30S ribosomal protein S1 [Aliifodinibius salipaludis]